jgi:hypothetical protein
MRMRWNKKNRRGQAMVESAMILLPVLAIMVGTFDFGQLLFTHQSLVERVREGLRWGAVRPYDGTGDQIANMIMYRQSTQQVNQQSGEPLPGYLGLTRANIQVTRTPGPAGDPNEDRLEIAIVNYQFKLLSPWIAKTFTNNTAVMESAPMSWKP